jgi:hypothetical protein
MKTRSPSESADALIQYFTLHTPILADQGINVRAFIDQLTALKTASATSAAAAPGRGKSRKH